MAEAQSYKSHAKNVPQLAWSAETRTIVSADQGGAMRVWHLADDAQRVLVGHTHDITPMMFSPSGGELLTGSNDKTIRRWDVAAGESRVLVGHAGAHQ
jgi:WD40 repeat protein